MSIKIFVKIHYFLVEIKKNIHTSRKIANNHKSLKKSQKVSKSLKKSQKVSKSLKKSQKVSILTEKYWICIWSLILNQDILIVKTRFLKLSRFSQLSRPALCQCGEQESWSRHDGDKFRPPGLVIMPKQNIILVRLLQYLKLSQKLFLAYFRA